MPITRTPWIDDDGTGTTGTIINNAEKQLLYNQIDAAIAKYGNWTPSDQSGAGLIFTAPSGSWIKVDRLVYVAFQVVWPSTANAAQAKVSLPFIVRNLAGGWQVYGATATWYAPAGSTVIQPWDPVTAGPLTNAAMTARNVIVNTVYQTD